MKGTVRDLQGFFCLFVWIQLPAEIAGIGRQITMQPEEEMKKTQLSTKKNIFFFVG